MYKIGQEVKIIDNCSGGDFACKAIVTSLPDASIPFPESYGVKVVEILDEGVPNHISPPYAGIVHSSEMEGYILMKPDWNEAPSGATHAGIRDSGGITWYKDVTESGYTFMHDQTFNRGGSPQWTTHQGGSPFWGPLIPRPTEWREEDGLPPVGTECEGKHNMTSNGWFRCTIRSYHGDKVWFAEHSENGERDFVYPVKVISFRPIQSERDRLANDLHVEIFGHPIMNDETDEIDYVEWCYAAVDSGWRKQMSRGEVERIIEFMAENYGTAGSKYIVKILDALGLKD